MQNRFVAAFFAYAFGFIGLNNFYTGHYFRGILDILLCWTCIPAIINVIRGCFYLWCDTDEDFRNSYINYKD